MLSRAIASTWTLTRRGHSMSRNLSSFTADMTRNLKVKVIAFDLSLILAGNDTNSTASNNPSPPSTPERPKFDISKTSLSIDNESMATMVGLDGDGHRHAPVTVDAPHTGKLITHSAQNATTGETSQMPSRKISKEELAAESVKSAAEYKHKYADKIKMKIAKQAQAAAAVPGGGNVLNIATRWLLKEGMGDVLDYTYNRTVKIAALGGYDRSNNIISQLKSQLNNTQLSFIRPHPLGAAANDAEAMQSWLPSHWTRPTNTNNNAPNKQLIEEQRKQLWENSMNDMEKALDVKKSQVLFVSGDETALSLARDHGYYTCRFTGEEKRFGQITTDFKAEDSLQIKDAIDGLIGIALRHSVSFIPFR